MGETSQESKTCTRGPRAFRMMIFFNLFKLEDNYFTILGCFLPRNNMNRPQVYVCPPTSWISLPCIIIITLISRRVNGG